MTITLVIGVATKLITPLKDFMQNYAGAYVECLLETGDLPYFLTSNANSECTIDKMEAAGRFTASTGGGGSGGKGNNSGSKSNSSSSGPKNNASNNQNRSGSGGSNINPQPIQGANTGADTSGSSGSGSGASRGAALANAANSAGAKSNNSGASAGAVPGSYDNDYGRGITGVVSVPNDMKSKDVKIAPNKPIKSDKKPGGDDLRKSSFSAPINEKPEKKQGPDLEGGMGFNFGMYIRYFIIGGIILALIVMVGTQINSLRKSWGTAN